MGALFAALALCYRALILLYPNKLGPGHPKLGFDLA